MDNGIYGDYPGRYLNNCFLKYLIAEFNLNYIMFLNLEEIIFLICISVLKTERQFIRAFISRVRWIETK